MQKCEYTGFLDIEVKSSFRRGAQKVAYQRLILCAGV